MPYVSLGASFAKIDFRFTSMDGRGPESCRTPFVGGEWRCEHLSEYAPGRNQLIGKHSYFDYGYNYGVGFFYALTDNVSLNLEVNRTHLKPLKGYMEQKISGKYTNYKLGLNYHF